jgi:lipopolysaccharide export system protein LptC
MVKSTWTRIALGVLLSGAIGCFPGRPLETTKVTPEIRLEDLRFRAYRDGRLAAMGEAASADYLRDSGDFSLESMSVTLPPPEGGAETRITAPLGSGNARAGDLLASGGVRLERGTDRAATEEALYRRSDGVVRGDHPISVEGTGYVLAGPRFVLDPRAQALRIEGGARLVASGRAAR